MCTAHPQSATKYEWEASASRNDFTALVLLHFTRSRNTTEHFSPVLPRVLIVCGCIVYSCVAAITVRQSTMGVSG